MSDERKRGALVPPGYDTDGAQTCGRCQWSEWRIVEGDQNQGLCCHAIATPKWFPLGGLGDAPPATAEEFAERYVNPIGRCDSWR